MEYIVNLLLRLRFTVIGLYGPHTLVRALLKITEPTSSLQSELSRSLLDSVIFIAVVM